MADASSSDRPRCYRMTKRPITAVAALLAAAGCAQYAPSTILPVQLAGHANSTAVASVTERQFVDPAFSATFAHTVVGTLEHPQSDLAQEDTGTKGVDQYRFTVTQPEQRTFQVERFGSGPHTVRILDGNGGVVATIGAEQTSTVADLQAGTYTVELTHGGGAKVQHHAVFIMPTGSFATAGNLFGDWYRQQWEKFTRILISGCPGGNFSNVTWSGMNLGAVNLSGATLKGAKLVGTGLAGANLSGANLEQADLTDADLSQANISNANFVMAPFTPPGQITDYRSPRLAAYRSSPTRLVRTNLQGANLTSAKISGMLPLQYVFWYRYTADMSGANLSGATLGGNVEPNYPLAFITADNGNGLLLPGAKMQNVTLTDKSLANANLSQADLTGTNLVGVDLKGANLSGATLTNTGL